MALEQQRRLLTYEDYAAMPDNGKRYELIDGVLYMTPSPTFWHQRLGDRLYYFLQRYLDTHPIGDAVTAPLDVILGPKKHQTFQPDVMFISKERHGIITAANIQGAPDLVIEVLSEGTARRDLGPKKRAYERYGVAEYWIVWSDMPRVEAFRRGKGKRFDPPVLWEEGDSITTPLLPGFSLALADLYADLPADV